MASQKKGTHFYKELRLLMLQKEQTLEQLADGLSEQGYNICLSTIGKYRARFPMDTFLTALTLVGYTGEELERLMVALQRDLRDQYLPQTSN